MWRAVNSDGTLTYSFIESVEASYAGYVVRFIGGAIFFSGMLVMAWNIWKTRQLALSGDHGNQDAHEIPSSAHAGKAGSEEVLA